MGLKKRHNSKMMDETDAQDSPPILMDDEKPRGDFINICLLMFLYLMQGVPLGLAAAVPYMLQSDVNTASYKTQATFSIASWPFSLKLAWAPLVDSIYSSRIGRRKTWLIPVQYAIGIDLLVLASHVDSWLGREPDNPWGPMGIANPVDITQLTAAFFGLTMLAATQDIAVDGWALTMLSKRNLGWASTCNSVGQTLGYVIAFILLLCLESPDIANNYLRSIPVEGKGLISFSGFLYFWGVAFLVTTTIVGLTKHETGSTVKLPFANWWKRSQRRFKITGHLRGKHRSTQSPTTDIIVNHFVVDDQPSEVTLLESESDASAQQLRVIRTYNRSLLSDSCEVLQVTEENQRAVNSTAIEDESELSLIDTYRVMVGVLRLKPILQYIGLLFLVKTCFAASDSVTILKLIELGVSKERMAFLGVMLLPFQAALPLLITRWTNGPSPLSLFSLAIVPRFFEAAMTIPLVHFTPHFREVIPPSHPLNITGSMHNSTAENLTTYSFTWTFYSIFLVHMAIHSVLANIMFVSQMAFHARISDPAVGGTYMTLLNTAVNMAGTLPSTILLYLVEPMSRRECRNPDPIKAGKTLLRTVNRTLLPGLDRIREMGNIWIDKNATCKPTAGLKACQLAGGECVTLIDGFYLEVIICVFIGLATYLSVIRPLAKQLESLPPSAYSFRSTNIFSCCRKRRHRPNTTA